MKKFLYCACVAALATACSNEDLIQENADVKSTKGITFEASIAAENPLTRGEMTPGGINASGNQTWGFFWYAEQDRINVYALGENVGLAYPEAASDAGVSLVDEWKNANVLTVPVYKATKSASQGQFTAKDDANMLTFSQNNRAVDFIATYPTTTKPFNVESESEWTTTNGQGYYRTVVKSYGIVVEKPNAVQTVNFNELDAPMVSVSTAYREKNYESVGEKVQLNFERPFPALRFGSVANNNNYNSYLGKLKSVTIETKGGKSEDYVLEATGIGRTAADGVTQDGVWTSESMTGILAGMNPVTNKVTVELTPAAEWTSDKMVFMSIMPVQRQDVVQEDGTEVDFTEDYTVTYTYEYVTLAKNLTSSANWNVKHAIYGVKDLDIAADFPYIVTNDNKLIVFSGNYSAIYTDDKEAIKWESAENGEVAFSSIKEIVVEDGVTVSTSDLQNLNKFTALETLNLKGVESIPASTFDGTLTSTIKNLYLPKVTEIADRYNGNFSALVNLDLSSYAFSVAGIEKKFFNDNVKNTLTTLDIAAVTSLRPVFSVDRSIAFTDYTALNSVVLNSECVALTTSAFKGCTSLRTVTGVVDIANAPNAFEGTTALSTVNVYNTIIPNYAFKGSKVMNVKYNGQQVAPTEVGEQAFKNNTAIYKMDLSQAAKIGYDAFSGAENYKGSVDNDRSKNATVLTVGAETINKGTFWNTKVKYVQFKNATSLGNNVFGRCNELKHVKFLKVVAGDYSEVTPFGTTSTENIDLFVVPEQSDTNGNTWNLLGKTFKSITKETTEWGATE